MRAARLRDTHSLRIFERRRDATEPDVRDVVIGVLVAREHEATLLRAKRRVVRLRVRTAAEVARTVLQGGGPFVHVAEEIDRTPGIGPLRELSDATRRPLPGT